MDKKNNSKILGSILIGISMVALAFILNSMQKTDSNKKELSKKETSPIRTQIEVFDVNEDGVQDWQEEFVSATPVIFNYTEEYIPPSTLTDQLGVTYFQNSLSAKTYGSFGHSQNEIIKDTINGAVLNAATDKLYSLKDIKVTEVVSGPTVRNYANSMASALINNNDPTAKNEQEVLRSIASKGNLNEDDLNNLKKLEKVYEKTIADSLKATVPKSLVKEHLDVLNTYQAIYADISGFTQLENDPLVALMRLKRYEDDSLGLNLAIKNIYYAITPYAEFFEANDSALIFASFAADFNI